MSESMSSFIRLKPHGTVEEVLDDYRENYSRLGNDLDLLTQSMMLIEAGHYQEGMRFALQVCLPPVDTQEPPPIVDKHAAKAAFLAAIERARHLYEQAAYEIEGKVDDSQTMSTYFKILDMLRHDEEW